MSSTTYPNVSGGGGGSSNTIIQPNPPADTSKLWFNTTDGLFYEYVGTEWLSEQRFEALFNDQGGTPNNTFLRNGNTVNNDLGVGFPLAFAIKVVELTCNRAPNTAQLGNFILYSNTATGTNNAAPTCTFTVTTTAIETVLPTGTVNIDAGKYISMRWQGAQTNNNIVVLRYRKRHV